MIPWLDYALVLFDFDDTLVDFSFSERSAVAAVCKNYDRHASEELMTKFRAINRNLWAQHDTGTLSRDEVFHERFRLFLMELEVEDHPQTANELFLSALSHDVTVFSNALELLSGLRAHVKVGIITNGHGPTQRLRAKRAGIADLVDLYVISDEVGVSKPDRRIFDLAYQLSGLPNGMKTLMIGDNLKADIGGAQSVGFDTCWISGGKSADASISPTYAVGGVEDLLFSRS